ncbi:NAD(P)H-binding protein [Leifsonia sp. fls2-241-R2A-40a]|uniref:NAD(P)-dependent oxidoreductase n=1 Tax=Leifsonia sp. fls2-241-R2A-40a TaxID=3040290 RepID=UPI00254ED9BE|nr:NAD(P)H-binding protein [Leifsonia sp. fls2-241-R2A-40a]
MKLTIFGASGRTGRLLTRQAIEQGHDVTVVLRRPSDNVDARAGVRILPSLDDTAEVRAALAEADAALSAIGPRSRAEAPVAAPATRAILAGAAGRGLRFVVISAAPVEAPPADDSFLSRRIALPLIGVLLRPVYDDLREMERELRDSDTVWTAFRPPMLTSGPATGTYRTRVGGSVPRGFTVSRADLADGMVASLHRPETERAAVGIAG